MIKAGGRQRHGAGLPTARRCARMSEARPSVRSMPAALPALPLQRAVQASFDELGTPLRETTFVVVDLETTGGSAHSCEITEIGAVKVRGGEVLGEFQTLVRPGAAIPPFIAVLTGITDAMVAGAPRLEQALPAFLEFARGTVLVAHNAPFDLGFLKAGCDRLEIAWPGHDSLDTAKLARRVLTRDEAPNCKLGTLARVFRSTTNVTSRSGVPSSSKDSCDSGRGGAGRGGAGTAADASGTPRQIRPPAPPRPGGARRQRPGGPAAQRGVTDVARLTWTDVRHVR